MQLPLVPLRDVVIFPGVVTSLFVGRDKSIKSLQTAVCKDLIDLSLPTNKEVTTPGKITTSLKGTKGNCIFASLYFYMWSVL